MTIEIAQKELENLDGQYDVFRNRILSYMSKAKTEMDVVGIRMLISIYANKFKR
jgi:hypothetical protein